METKRYAVVAVLEKTSGENVHTILNQKFVDANSEDEAIGIFVRTQIGNGFGLKLITADCCHNDEIDLSRA